MNELVQLVDQPVEGEVRTLVQEKQTVTQEGEAGEGAVNSEEVTVRI